MANKRKLSKAILTAHASAMFAALSAAEFAAEPEDAGFCSQGCNRFAQMPLIKDTVTYDNGQVGDRYRWQHDSDCWFGKIRAVLDSIDKEAAQQRKR